MVEAGSLKSWESVRVPRIEEISLLEAKERKTENILHFGVVYFLRLLGRHSLFASSLQKELLSLEAEFEKLSKFKKRNDQQSDVVQAQQRKIQLKIKEILDRLGKVNDALGELAGKLHELKDNDKKLRELIAEVTGLGIQSTALTGKSNFFKLKIINDLISLFESLSSTYGYFQSELKSTLNSAAAKGNALPTIEILQKVRSAEKKLNSLIETAEKFALESRHFRAVNTDEMQRILRAIEQLPVSKQVKARPQTF